MKRKMTFPIYYSLPFLLLVLPDYGWSQSKADVIFGKIKTAIRVNLTCAERQPTMFFNKRAGIFDFSDYQIPLKEVEVVFSYNADAPQCGNSWVKFDCIQGNCITTSDGPKSAIEIPLKSKTKCYELINLFGEFQDTLR